MVEILVIELTTISALGSERQCNGCTVCCTVMAVVELGKPYYCKCEYQQQEGCGIYKKKPQTCGYYECLWLASEIDIHPRESGILYTLEQDRGLWWIEVYEAAKDKLTMDYVIKGLILAKKMELKYFQKFGGIKIYRWASKLGVDFTVTDKYSEFKQVSNSNRSYISRGTNYGYQAAIYVGNHPDDHDSTEDIKQVMSFWAQLESCGRSSFKGT